MGCLSCHKAQRPSPEQPAIAHIDPPQQPEKESPPPQNHIQPQPLQNISQPPQTAPSPPPQNPQQHNHNGAADLIERGGNQQQSMGSVREFFGGLKGGQEQQDEFAKLSKLRIEIPIS